MKKDDPTKTRSNRKISKREIEWLGYVLAGHSARDAGRKIGLSARAAKRTDLWIKVHREDSRKPYLWDIWREQLDKQLRILEAKSDTILRELCLIAFSSIDQFIEIPSREDAMKAAAKNEELIASITGEESEDGEEETIEQKAKQYRPGSTIKLKYIEDIPKDLIPAIASIKETRDGIEVKLHSKMDALDKLARITKLFNQEPTDEVPFGGEINIHVKGSKSPMLLSIGGSEQQPETK
jgi:hypothetical protein